ncbi:MAG: hypothetical protein JW810_14360 [Sedimentisphaerales bacterium]|nr:hypothetical protein [Sedimentisphaerales bacterium]
MALVCLAIPALEMASALVILDGAVVAQAAEPPQAGGPSDPSSPAPPGFRAADGREFHGEFIEAARLPGATVAHSATVLDDGRILVAGGYGKLFDRLPMAVTLLRIYEPKTNAWRVLNTALASGRLGHAARRLSDGKVLIVGGRGQDSLPVHAVERFDPDTEECTAVGRLTNGRTHPNVNILSDGRVLVTGQSRQAEWIEPDPNQTGGLVIRPVLQHSKTYYSSHIAAKLPDDTILLAGGWPGTIERFDPRTETYETCRARLPFVLDDQAAVFTGDGTLLLAGGQDIGKNRSIGRSWLYDPSTDTITDGPAFYPRMPNPADRTPRRLEGVSDLQCLDLLAHDPLRRGRYLFFCGGEFDPGKDDDQPDIVLDAAWVYDADGGNLIDVGPMLHPHDEFAIAPLPAAPGRARVLIIGGYDADDSFHSHCEIFEFALN